MKQITAVVLIFLILMYPALSHAKEKRGTDLVIQTKAGQVFRGELITVKRYALLLLSEEGADVTVDIRETSHLTIVRKSKFGSGFAYGALALGGVTALAGAGATLESEDEDTILAYLIIVGGAAVIGGLLGGAVGAASGKDKAIEVSTLTEEEITVLLDDLRSRARIPDYQ